MCLMACVAFSQNLLEITDISQPNDVYTGDNDRAAVIFKCNQSIPLTFESSMDKSATPYNTELEGSDMVYYIEFPTGQKYRGRMLTITSPGYAPATVFIDDLQPKQVLTYQAYRPEQHRRRWLLPRTPQQGYGGAQEHELSGGSRPVCRGTRLY